MMIVTRINYLNHKNHFTTMKMLKKANNEILNIYTYNIII